jgi:glucose/arabinose dehydrogenase
MIAPKPPARVASLGACFLAAALAAAPAQAQPAGETAKPGPAPAAQPAAQPEDHAVAARTYKTVPVVENVEVPWAITWLPDGRMVFTERPGRVRIVDADGKLRSEPLLTVENVMTRRGAEVGLMGMCLHPRFAENHYVYLAYGYDNPADHESDVRVVRYVMKGEPGAETLEQDRIIDRGAPMGPNHAGCRIKFGPDGKLYITHGEKFERDRAQDLMDLGGKILRVNDDGTVPEDNPFVGRQGARPEIWTLGNRNPQGIDWQPGTGLLFEVEHGPSGENGRNADEFNLIEKGKNYGWPAIKADETAEGMESPLHQWTPSIAPCAGNFYTGDLFPKWKGKFMVAALGGLNRNPTPGIFLITIEGRKYAGEERVCTEFGRIREVVTGPDGAIYFSTSNKDGRGKPKQGDDKILKLVPAE